MYRGSKAGDVLMDLVGKKFGSLTVLPDHISVSNKHGTKIKFKCRCDCGEEDYYYRESLLNRKVNYCKKCRPNGIRHSKLYHVYHGIKQRCYNVNNQSYEKYGGKGITMCDSWLSSYDVFEQWAVSNGYTDGLTIDRIDSSKGYCPENCRWISLSENSARANYGKHKNITKLVNCYAILPNGEKEEITNLTRFAAEHNLKLSTVSAILHGRMPPVYHDYEFHSNLSRKV